MTAETAERAVEALRSGGIVVIPTDTVYGIAALAESETAASKLFELKLRDPEKPVSLLAASVDAVLEALPELEGTPAAAVLRALLPGAYTFVVPNPARRYGWLCGGCPESIGVRVPRLTADLRRVVGEAGVLGATSANLAGLPSPDRVSDISSEIRAAADAVLDGGVLRGVESTVVDLTVRPPAVLRAGAVPAQQALDAVQAVIADLA